ncbi:MAG TPA: cupin domain-containing protein [Amaricoccus sp.]|uniref:cupin domain-containing protein n=1 Tax=Amaricoccus sp. TaxID=1872485 RepID=UPI002C13EB80|nr:cupin domain-containing protein [Amaricoccus sp.]HMQ93510.1 cupin domain-containing protein [Amaricoccus sp.]HMR54422.1 cupin domain-containing protein [Amaricoccus sp.]HMR61554.1 cupin domain-containing protein [Amaricoccus sp.]HMU00501.1 cupin domain-containing protein [Amaricoccus sp.]
MPKIARPPFARRHVIHPFTGEDLGEYSNANLGDAAGLTQFGAHLEILHPGGKTSMRHWHETEDEFVYVIEGSLTLVEDIGETPLAAGDAAAWAAGAENAHRLENRGTADATYLVVGTRRAQDRIHYPEHDLIVTHDGPRRIYARTDGTILKET